MPTYEYACERCEDHFDVVQSFHDDPLTTCPTCGSPVRKVFGNVGIVFKGSGFYKTDSRNGSRAKKETESTSAPASGSETSDSKGDGKDSSSPKESSPAEKPSPAASTPSDTKPKSGAADKVKKASST